MISFVRVDNRLIHGQVVEAWLPHLRVDRVVVADDEAAHSPLIRAAMGLAVQDAVEVEISSVASLDCVRVSTDAVPTLVLVREVKDAVDVRARGLEMKALNLGNVHFASGRRRVAPSVFLAEAELQALELLAAQQVEVEARAVPSDAPVRLKEMRERFAEGA